MLREKRKRLIGHPFLPLKIISSIFLHLKRERNSKARSIKTRIETKLIKFVISKM
jgi:hypothetical protein